MSMVTSAMILAAGRGERMKPLTDHTPKPLLEVNGKPLLVYHLEKLAAMGVNNVVINHAWLGEQIEQRIGNGDTFGLRISYSPEAPVLETAGGIAKALPQLGDAPFLVVNGDVWSNFDFAQLNEPLEDCLARLVMVANPEHHPKGDFCLVEHLLHMPDGVTPTYTYSGIALFDPRFFSGIEVKRQALAPILTKYIRSGRVAGHLHQGIWCDVGTPERLAMLNQES